MKAKIIPALLFALTIGFANGTPESDFDTLTKQKAEAIKKIEKAYAENAQKIAAAAIQAGDLKLALKIKEEVGINEGPNDVSFLEGDWVLTTRYGNYNFHIEKTGSFHFASWADEKVITFVRNGDLLTPKGLRFNVGAKKFKIISPDLLQGVEMVNGKFQDTDEQLKCSKSGYFGKP